MKKLARTISTAAVAILVGTNAAACSSSSPTPKSSSVSSTATPSSAKSTSTSPTSSFPTGEAALGITANNPTPAPSMGEGPIVLKDGSGNAEITGLTARQNYVVLMACAGGGEVRALDNHGIKVAGIGPGCQPGGLYSFNLTPARDMITSSGHLRITAPSTTHWTVGVWKRA